MSPPVKSARGGHGATEICHGQSHDEDASARQEPRPDHAGGAGCERERQRAGDGREEAHDREGYAKDFEGREVPFQLLLVAHLGQELRVRLACENDTAIAGSHEIRVVVMLFG